MPLIKPSKIRLANASKVDVQPLYSGPHRRAIPVLLILLLLYGLALLAWGIVLSVVSDLAYGGASDVVIAILKWDIIPLICVVVNIVQLVQRRRRTLLSSHIVAVGVCATLVWIGYGFLGFVEANAWTEGFDATMFYTAIAGIVLNLVYMSFGASALHRERNPKNFSTTSRSGPGRLSNGGSEDSELDQDVKESV